MKLAFATNQNRVTSLFPGVTLILMIVNTGTNSLIWQEVKTYGWKSLLWGKQLAYYDVDILFCSGIEQFIYGSIRGFGIYVVPNCIGTAEEILKQWQSGFIKVPAL